MVLRMRRTGVLWLLLVWCHRVLRLVVAARSESATLYEYNIGDVLVKMKKKAIKSLSDLVDGVYAIRVSTPRVGCGSPSTGSPSMSPANANDLGTLINAIMDMRCMRYSKRLVWYAQSTWGSTIGPVQQSCRRGGVLALS